MTILKSFQTIESLSFSVQYGVTNSLQILLLAWNEDASIQELIQILRENPEQQSLLLERVQTLAMTEFESGAWHPQDIAVTAYLSILGQLDSLKALEEATKIVEATKGFFWARKLAQKIISEKLQKHPNS
jgi:hypothetical protein